MRKLTSVEVNEIKSILNYGLNINPNLNFSYFLNAIRNTDLKVGELETKIDLIISNQSLIDQKLNRIMVYLNNLQKKG